MSEDKATRWRRMSREQRERLMSAVAAIQTGMDELAGEVLTEALSPDNETLLHPQDRRALQREQCRRAKEARHGCKVRHL